MTDTTTKLLLAAIACGLWANVALHVIRPAAATPLPDDIKDALHSIAGSTAGADKSLYRIYKGECPNTKLC